MPLTTPAPPRSTFCCKPSRNGRSPKSAYYRSLVDYNRAIEQVHYVKGSLLEYDNVFMAEGPWPGKAYFDARRLARTRDASHQLDYGFTRPDVFSRGEYPQFGPTANANDNQGTPTPAIGESIETPKPAGAVPSVIPGPVGNGGPNEKRARGSSTAPGTGSGSTDDDRSSDTSSELQPVPTSVRKPRELQTEGPRLGSATGTMNRAASANGELGYPSSRRVVAATGEPSGGTSSDAPSRGWKSTSAADANTNGATADGWQKAAHPAAGE